MRYFLSSKTLHLRVLTASAVVLSLISFAVQAQSRVSLTFQPCLGGDCRAVSFQKCGENATNVHGACVCNAGFFGDGHTCVSKTCEAGFYPFVDHQTGEASCVACPAGYACPDGQTKLICPANTYSAAGAGDCKSCDEAFWSDEGAPVCCPAGKKYDDDQQACVGCSADEGCGCPEELPFVNAEGVCVACVSNTQCATGICSNNTCCPANTTNVKGGGLELAVKGCFCKTGYQPNASGTACVMPTCSEIEHSSENGTGNATSVNGCFCDESFPYFQNGRCMRAKNCAILMESYGYKSGRDFRDHYKFRDQEIKNVIYIKDNFITRGDMNLIGCNLVVEGNFYNAYHLEADSLMLNFPKFEYDASRSAKNSGVIEAKGLTVSVFENNGTVRAPMATAVFGKLVNRGTMIVDNVLEMNDSDSTLTNSGTLSVLTDFMFGALSETGSISNSGKIVVGHDWEGGELYNWDTIEVGGSFNQDDSTVHNEGTIRK